MNAKEFCRRLDAALRNRIGAPRGELKDVKCEVCGDNIHNYNGPKSGIMCSTCMNPTGEGECVRFMPLAITRGTLNE